MKKKATLSGIKVGGITPFTTIDFPGRLAAVIYTQGCPWRCRFCHNGPLLDPTVETDVTWEDVLPFLSLRTGFLDGVVFSGGEPSFWPDLPSYIKAVREMGYDIALHTNGAYPERIKHFLESRLLDMVALDIKAPFDDYEKITGVAGSGKLARESAGLLLASGIDVEFRTTVHPDLLTPEELRSMARELHDMGVKRYAVQKCRTEYSLDPAIRKEYQELDPFLEDLKVELEEMFPSFIVR